MNFWVMYKALSPDNIKFLNELEIIKTYLKYTN